MLGMNLRHRQRWTMAALAGLALSIASWWAWHNDSQAQPQPAPDVPLGSLTQCRTHTGLPLGFGQDRLSGMQYVPAGEFEPGSTQGYRDERPRGRVRVQAFWMDRTEVTNAQFAAFVAATGYVTDAEKIGGAAVFMAPRSAADVRADGDWWHYMAGANWRHPEGPQSTLQGRDNEPVTMVSQQDALAYARWLNRDLPTEAEWEWAARGHSQPERIERDPIDPTDPATGKPLANYWQGIFPVVNSGEDGFSGRSPVGCFVANGYGLYDMIGNVWEWTQDRYAGEEQGHGNGDPAMALRRMGIRTQASDFKTIKGGSFLCSSDYCVRYRASARYPQEANLGATHIGFRTVVRIDAL